MENAEAIAVSADGGVVTVRLNRPQRRNALREQDFVTLARRLAEVNTDPAARVVVLTGAGGDFSSGADQADMSGADGPRATIRLMWALQNTARALHEVRVPVLAAVQGLAIGAGSSLALGSDLVYAAPTARFGQLFVDRALTLDLGASAILVRRVGLSRAKELAFSAAMVPADEALRIGLIDGVVADEDFDEQIHERAAVIAEKPPLALAMIKDQLNRAVTSTLTEALDYESIGQSLAAVSSDAAEARAAFFDKRRPNYSGH